MADQVKIKIEPQFVETLNIEMEKQQLHKIQAAMLEYSSLKEAVILTAPTGTGKSYSFPLPILAAKQRGGISQMRCIIVSPTNALIEDMKREYSAKFSPLKTEVLNRKKLDELNAHGLKRWDEILNIVRDNDIIITNPDLLNWAIFGGYSFSKKQHHIGRLLALVDYIVFDEYHLYDEEQIANILSWMILKRTLLRGKPIKFIFASATPEPSLAELLKQYDFDVQEICETITNQPSQTARQIHGEITIIFRNIDRSSGETDADAAIENYLWKNKVQIENYLNRGDRVLVMVDRMVSLRRMREKVKNNFSNFNIAEESGYFTKSNHKEDTANANLILATNKVEVGVNLNVKVCLMPTGKYLANFIQRFGRVARGDMHGLVVVFVEKIEQLKTEFNNCSLLSYYNFIEKCRNIEFLNNRNFYIERIPRFLGAYFFVIQERTIKDYAAKHVFKENLHLDEFEGETKFMFHTLRIIHKKILYELKSKNDSANHGYSWELKCIREWWIKFLETFRYFRSNAPSIKFIDKDFDLGEQFQEYSLEWVLTNRFIIGERSINGIRYVEVSGFRDEKNELQFIADSFPFGKLTEEHRYLSQKERWNLKQAFLKRVKLCLKYWQQRSQDEFSKAIIDIIYEIEKLRMIFTTKRLSISDITEYSNFL